MNTHGARRDNQRGQAVAVVLVIMALVFLLVGGVTMALSALVRQQNPDRQQTTNDLAAQNAVAATAADISSGQSACSQPAQGNLLSAPAFANDWNFSGGPWSQSSTELVFGPPAAGAVPTPVAATQVRPGSSSWHDYTAVAQFQFPAQGGMTLGTRIELDAADQLQGTYAFAAVQEPDSPQSGSATLQVGLAGGQSAQLSLPQKRPSSVTLELDIIGELITGRVSSDAWGSPGPLSVTTGPLAGTVAITVTSSSEVDVTSVTVDGGVPAPQDMSSDSRLVPPLLVVPPGTASFYCERLDQVGTVTQQRIALSQSPGPCPSQVSSNSVVSIDPNQDAKVWFSFVWPQGAQQPLRLDLGTGAALCPAPTNGQSMPLADCGDQRSSRLGTTSVWFVAADCVNTGSKRASYSVYLTSFTGTQAGQAPNLQSIELHWAPSGQAATYMTVASVPGQLYEEGDLSMVQGSVALTYEGVLG